MRGIDIPTNVKVFYDIDYGKYLEMMQKSKLVVIPLVSHIRSLGMVVMLEAMAYGKPVVTTRGISNVEYIRDGENGYLVEPEDPQVLKDRILELLGDPIKYRQIAETALADVKEHWSFKRYVETVLEIAEGLAQ